MESKLKVKFLKFTPYPIETVAMAKEMLKLCYLVAPNIFKYAGPSCVSAGKCYQGNRDCGKSEEVKKEFEQYFK